MKWLHRITKKTARMSSPPLPALLLLLLCSPILATPTSNTTDRLALLAFRSLLATPSPRLAAWRGAASHCTWPGVLCNDTRNPGRVTHLLLGSSGLRGAISPSLSNLTFLSTLNLSTNSLHGPIPPELGRLPHLRYLSLKYNSLDGEIPSELTASCSNLQILYLNNNRLQGPIPSNLSSCIALLFLNLGRNMLSGGIPSSLGNLPLLEQLWLDNNNLTGELPPSLGNLSSLTDLHLQFNALEGSIPVELARLDGLFNLDLMFNRLSGRVPPALFYNHSNLYGLALAHNNLSGTLPPDFGTELPNLGVVHLYDNQFEGRIPPAITNASGILVLSLTNNRFTGKVPGNIGLISGLEELSLGKNRFEATLPDDWSFITSLGNCTELVKLDIWRNNFSGSLPGSIGNLSAKLELLAMGYNRISGSIPSGVGNLRYLQELDVANGLFSGPIPDSIGGLFQLRRMSLAENRFLGAIPWSMGNLSQLIELYLNNNSLGGAIPESLGSLQKLNTLDLSYNKLTGYLPKGLLHISTLSSFLNISNNLLQGQLPNEFHSLINLVALDVSANRFSGAIPSSLGVCQLMQYLNMSYNELAGTIPKSLGDLKVIQMLDLSKNLLSGPVPQFLEASFPSLNFLNLSFNDLDGELPVRGLFGNSSLFSVLGNEKLCGGISELHLRSCSKKKQGLTRTVTIVIIVAASLIFLLVSLLLLRKCFVGSRTLRKAFPRDDSENWLFPKVSYRELVTATDGFSPANLIGQGGSGMVYMGILGVERMEVAVKVLHPNLVGATKTFITECNVLRSIRHRNLVRIITSCSATDFGGNEFRALVYEFMPNGSLEAWLHSDENVDSSPRVLDVYCRFRVAMDITAALDYLHNHTHEPVLHCDLKPSNVLLRKDMTACIGDFGLAKFLSTNAGISSGIKGSIGYIAPERGMGGPISPLWDIYSFGVLLLEMFIGKRPTDESFNSGLSLHEYVNARFPGRIMEIIDPKLFQKGEHEQVSGCLVDIIEVALICSRKMPGERMTISDASKRLNAIRDVLFD